MSSPETLKPTGERTVELEKAAGERLKTVHEQLEKKSERSGERSGEILESARRETEAAFSPEVGKERRSGGEPSGGPVHHATKQQRKTSYDTTMRQIRSEMNASSRTFSKIIHNVTVEKVSDVVGNTAARPNAILAGSVCATFLTLAVFLVAKQFGYRLSGFETIGTFVLGWLLGLMYDYVRILWAGKRSS